MLAAIIVVPCYNEAQRLQIHKFKDYACDEHGQRFSSSMTAAQMAP
jgi:hypothetical protein